MSRNSFGAAAQLDHEGRSLEIFRLDAVGDGAAVERLPYSLKTACR
jgi:hypothetical protein